MSDEGARHKHAAGLILIDGWLLISLDAISAALLGLITVLLFPNQSQPSVQCWVGLVIHMWCICLALGGSDYWRIKWVLASQGKSMELSFQACWRCCACFFFFFPLKNVLCWSENTAKTATSVEFLCRGFFCLVVFLLEFHDRFLFNSVIEDFSCYCWGLHERVMVQISCSFGAHKMMKFYRKINKQDEPKPEFWHTK